MAKWTVDTLHTDVQFKVKHLMINTVTGEFTSYRVDVDALPDKFGVEHVSLEELADHGGLGTLFAESYEDEEAPERRDRKLRLRTARGPRRPTTAQWRRRVRG